MENNRFFFLNTICPLVNNRALTNAKIYEFYHNKIAEKQAEKFKQIKFVLDIVEEAGRKIDVDTDDPVEIQKKREKLALLSYIKSQINQYILTDDAEFLASVRKVIEYKLNQ